MSTELEVTPTVAGLSHEWRKTAIACGQAPVRDAYRNAADQLEVAMPTWRDIRDKLESEHGYLDSAALNLITDSVMEVLGYKAGLARAGVRG